MTAEPVRFLSVDEAEAIHEALTGRFGGSGGVRDPGLLESALYRPQTGHYRDLAEMAAALFDSLSAGPSFADGNVRVAFFATDVFLRLNGWKLRVDPEETRAFLLDFSEERRRGAHGRLVAWLRRVMARMAA